MPVDPTECVCVAGMMPQSALEHQEMKILFKPFYQHNRKSFCTFRIKVVAVVFVLVAIKDQLSSAYNLLLDLSSCSPSPESRSPLSCRILGVDFAGFRHCSPACAMCMYF